MSLYDARLGFPIPNGALILDSTVTLDDGVTLDLLGLADFRFQHQLRVGNGTTLQINEGQLILNGRILPLLPRRPWI